MAVQTQAGFQAQCVAGAQACGGHFRLGQQGLGQGDSVLGGHRDLKAVFPRVT